MGDGKTVNAGKKRGGSAMKDIDFRGKMKMAGL